MTDVTEGSSDATELAVAQAAQGGVRARRPLADLVQQNKDEIGKALPPGIMDAERFTRIVLTEFRKTPKLLVCTPTSFLGALFQTAQLGLEPGGQLGHAYLIPYDTRDKVTREDITEAQLQIGYKGYVELAGRRGILIRAREVREEDEFDFDLGSREYLHHSYKLRAGSSRVDQEVIGYYGKVVMPDGVTTFHVMDKSEINKRRDRSSAVRSGRRTPWDTDYDAMARKTVIRAMVPQIALAPDLQIALKADEAVVQRADSGDLSYLYRDAIDVSGPVEAPVEADENGEIRESITIQDTIPVDAPPEDPEGPQEPPESDPGVEAQTHLPVEPPSDEAPVETDLMRDTARQVNAWPIDTVKRVLREREQSTSGTHDTLRTRLIALLVAGRARGDASVEALFV